MYKNTKVLMASAIAAVLSISVLAFALPAPAQAFNNSFGGSGGIGGSGGGGGAGGNGGAVAGSGNAHGGNANGGHGGNANGGDAICAIGACNDYPK